MDVISPDVVAPWLSLGETFTVIGILVTIIAVTYGTGWSVPGYLYKNELNGHASTKVLAQDLAATGAKQETTIKNQNDVIQDQAETIRAQQAVIDAYTTRYEVLLREIRDCVIQRPPGRRA